MSKYLSPEQIDAVAVAIKNANEGSGSICADATGLGKGRVGAALARWAVLKGKPFVFVTDKGAQIYPSFLYRIVNRKLASLTTSSKRSPHVLRHTYATQLLDNGAEINSIK